MEVIIAKILQELPYEKRDGAKVADAYLFALAYDADKSTSEACSLLRSLEFIPEIAQTLKEDPDSVIEKLEATRKYCELILFRFTYRNWLANAQCWIHPSCASLSAGTFLAWTSLGAHWRNPSCRSTYVHFLSHDHVAKLIDSRRSTCNHSHCPFRL